MKSLCVYCSSSDRLDAKYFEAARQVGETIGRRGWSLVYGGGRSGLMGAVARAAKESGARVVGVIPEFMKERELAYTEADELISVITMRERKMLMETRADAFVALPGGWGTLEEIMEILTLAHLDALAKPIVIFNQDGYFDELLALFDKIIRERFMHEAVRQRYAVATSVEQIFTLIERWKTGVPEKSWFQTR
ncbi:MAG TPA: TIGR00730 family Rossman fold protein [Candidatus Didemnitutus sp.]|nr:TIGR00730 family Rossman fold protein [Candidatus Didemnitutus sp.]